MLFLILFIFVGIIFFLYKQDKDSQKSETIIKNIFNSTIQRKSTDNISVNNQNESPEEDNQQQKEQNINYCSEDENEQIEFKKLNEFEKNHFELTNEKEIKFFKKYYIPILIIFLIFVYYPMKIDVPFLMCDIEVSATYSIINQEITINMGSLKFKEKCNLFKYLEVKTKYIFCDKQELRQNIINAQESLMQNMLDNWEKPFDNMNL